MDPLDPERPSRLFYGLLVALLIEALVALTVLSTIAAVKLLKG